MVSVLQIWRMYSTDNRTPFGRLRRLIISSVGELDRLRFSGHFETRARNPFGHLIQQRSRRSLALADWTSGSPPGVGIPAGNAASSSQVFSLLAGCSGAGQLRMRWPQKNVIRVQLRDLVRNNAQFGASTIHSFCA